ncbi:Uncharacterised protein [Mycolicibacterium vanbaalenii]|uniref:Uncharacterized protein n=1 Tax=Mycolicibacterium vanbaalenii TaxID=110539 RepID=A0A5S9R8S6_MYCVN|nr:hypothetical protein [Mycolicibacterium vanbaalenii]CAA0131595.1 Uncharacterised protein [Mycolicibacterium vanbaalenii]
MGSPTSRARGLRGALVGVASSVMTVGAHAAAGGGVPLGGALVISLLVCATIGTAIGFLRLESRSARWLATTAALCAAQFLGHVVLVATGHHHAGSALGMSPSMAASHIGAAVVLGVAITSAEYLYVVCSSVLCWLRLFSLRAPRPAVRTVRRTTNIVAVQPVFTTGLGMRAPPRLVAAA